MDFDSPLWFPYAQMKTMTTPPRVARGEGACLILEDGTRLVDAVSSWWCVIHGYSHPEILSAAKEQLDRLPHVMLGGLVHDGAEALARSLVRITPAGLNHVFFSDSGSVAMEVALKMAIQFWAQTGRPGKRRFLALEQAYHGDTCGVMSICDPQEGMHGLFSPLLPQQLFAPTPTAAAKCTDRMLRSDLDRLEETLETHADELAGFVVEPLLQGAGGMNIYRAEYLTAARDLCDRYGVLFLFDEIATGFGRTGTLFAAEQAGVTPDIMAVGKGLTAGYTGHAATLATDRIYEAFWDDDPMKCFMHGPTFMANPVAMAVANASIAVFECDNCLDRIARIEAALRADLLGLTGPHVADTRVIGATGVVEADSPGALAGLQDFAMARGVWIRPFGRIAYTMPPYVITDGELKQVTGVLREWFGG
jgi:adenosylmethionine-8-amino-7-oxononanoate aminotransferase